MLEPSYNLAVHSPLQGTRDCSSYTAQAAHKLRNAQKTPNAVTMHLNKRLRVFLNVTVYPLPLRYPTHFVPSKIGCSLRGTLVVQICLCNQECVMPLPKNVCDRHDSALPCPCASKLDGALRLQPPSGGHLPETHLLKHTTNHHITVCTVSISRTKSRCGQKRSCALQPTAALAARSLCK